MEPPLPGLSNAGSASASSRLRPSGVGRHPGVQETASVRQSVAFPQDGARWVIGSHDHPTPVHLDDANPYVVQQLGEGRSHGVSSSQYLADAHELADMGEKTSDHVDLSRLPAARPDRIFNGPSDLVAIQPLEPDVQGVLPLEPAQHLVEGWRRLQFLLGIEVGDVHQPIIGQSSEAWYALVVRVVELQVVPYHLIVALAPVVDCCEKNLVIVSGAFGNIQGIAPGAAGFVDEGRGCRPKGVVQHSVV